MKAQRRSRGLALLFLQPSCYLGVGCQHLTPAAGKMPSTHFTGDWVRPRTGDDGYENFIVTGIRSLDHPTRSESQYPLLFPGLQ
jgi:hypothetical protein